MNFNNMVLCSDLCALSSDRAQTGPSESGLSLRALYLSFLYVRHDSESHFRVVQAPAPGRLALNYLML